jgi:hypothetical protein
VKNFRPIGKLTFPIIPSANSAGTLFASSQFSCAISEGCARIVTSTKYVLVEQALGVSPAFTCQ